MDNRENYGKVDIVYGSRTPDDLVHQNDIFNVWPSQKIQKFILQ